MNTAEKIALAGVIIAVVSLIAFIVHSIYPLPPVAVTPAVIQTLGPTPTPTADLGETFTNTIGMEFVLIPTGKFDMGSPSDEEGRYS